jgi:hypothetical protein
MSVNNSDINKLKSIIDSHFAELNKLDILHNQMGGTLAPYTNGIGYTNNSISSLGSSGSNPRVNAGPASFSSIFNNLDIFSNAFASSTGIPNLSNEEIAKIEEEARLAQKLSEEEEEARLLALGANHDSFGNADNDRKFIKENLAAATAAAATGLGIKTIGYLQNKKEPSNANLKQLKHIIDSHFSDLNQLTKKSRK